MIASRDPQRPQHTKTIVQSYENEGWPKRYKGGPESTFGSILGAIWDQFCDGCVLELGYEGQFIFIFAQKVT